MFKLFSNNLLTASISNPLYGLVPGNSQGIYTGTTTSRQTLLSPYPAFGSKAINSTENTGYSWYHSFQFTASRRFTKGYTVQGSYTLQKWMQAVNLLNASDAAPVREISDADAPHRINVSNIWSLPFGKGRAFMSNANPVVSRLAVERSLFEQTSTWPQGERLPLHRGYWRNVCKVTLPARLLTAAVC